TTWHDIGSLLQWGRENRSFDDSQNSVRARTVVRRTIRFIVVGVRTAPSLPRNSPLVLNQVPQTLQWGVANGAWLNPYAYFLYRKALEQVFLRFMQHIRCVLMGKLSHCDDL